MDLRSPEPFPDKNFSSALVGLAEEIIESRAEGYQRATLPEVDGFYELYASPILVQAVGTFYGVDFYFHAKDGEWYFETQGDDGCIFVEGHPNYFLRRGTYDQAERNAMSLDWSLRIFRKCLAEFWEPAR